MRKFTLSTFILLISVLFGRYSAQAQCVATGSITDPDFRTGITRTAPTAGTGWIPGPLCSSINAGATQTFSNWKGSGVNLSFNYSTTMWDGDAPNIYVPSGQTSSAGPGCNNGDGVNTEQCSPQYHGSLRWTNNINDVGGTPGTTTGPARMELVMSVASKVSLFRLGAMSKIGGDYEWVHVKAYDAANNQVSLTTAMVSSGYVDCDVNGGSTITQGNGVNAISDGNGGLYLVARDDITQSDKEYGHADVDMSSIPAIKRITADHWRAQSTTDPNNLTNRKEPSSITINVVCLSQAAPVCNAPTPTGVAADRCGSGTVTLTSSGCTTAYPARWYSNSNLTTQVGTGNSFTTPSITATTTYYVACVETATPTCKSTGVSVVATVKPNPTITTATPVCNSAGTQFEVSYTATANSTITTSAGTVQASNNKVVNIPSGTTVTITATLNDCVATATATQNCTIPCITPTAAASAANATCNAGTANSNASIRVAAFANNQRYRYSSGNSFTVGSAIPASITAIPAGGVIVNNLPNTAATYTVRIYDATDNSCFVDRTVNITVVTCTPNCVPPQAGDDAAICLPKTTLDLTDAPTGSEWIAVAGNPSVATINAATGEITGLSQTGVYSFRLQKTGDATCSDVMTVTVSNGDAANLLCNDGSTSFTLTAAPNITNVIWYSMDGTQVGTGNTLLVSSNTSGLADGTEAYYYVGEDTAENGCAVELCCPVKFISQDCCPTPNCLSVTVNKN